jgi:hypothetical protein
MNEQCERNVVGYDGTLSQRLIIIGSSSPPQDAQPMTLASFVRTLLGDAPIGPTALAANISAGRLYNLLTGKVKEPQPQTLARLARHFGATDAERRRLYAQMMALAGYLTLLPREMLDVLHQGSSATFTD